MEFHTIEDKIQGMFYGASLGDAWGCPYEFHRSKSINLQPELSSFSYSNRFGYQYSTSPGQVTDDTEMAIQVSDRVLEDDKKVWEEKSIVESYLSWANSKMPFLGRNTRELFKGIKTFRGYQKRFHEKYLSLESREASQSNGAMMRCYPLAILGYASSYEDIKPYIKRDCYITNPSSVALQCNEQYIYALILALQGETKQNIISALDPNNELEEKKNIKINKGWCKNALWCVRYGLEQFDSYYDAIHSIIQMGGDTDTNASITGAMLGAYYGYKEMGKGEKGKIIHKLMNQVIQLDTTNTSLPRPERYQQRRIPSISERCVRFIHQKTKMNEGNTPVC